MNKILPQYIGIPSSKDDEVLRKLLEYCVADVINADNAFERGITIHSMIDIESGVQPSLTEHNLQLEQYCNQMKIIDEAWMKEPEKHDFKCQANHRDKGHVKPFYRQGRW